MSRKDGIWDCPNHRDNYLCSPARRAGEHEKLLGTDTPRDMTLVQKRLLILAEMLLAGAVSGRLAVRALLNLLLGGTLFFGGIFYEGQHEKTRK